ncbi:MAG: DUF6798 domain-containing protein, partial [Rhodothermales bacterium]
LFVLAGALLLYFLRFGYDYGTSDQDEVLPLLLHRLDPEVLAQDWFILTQAAGFSIRTYFVSMLEVLSWLLPVWLSVLLLYVAAWLLIAAAVYALGYAFTRNRPAAAAAVIGALVLTPQWTLGGNDLVHSMLVPSMWGWALGLWGLVYFLRSKPGRAAVLLGLATWMQALVGLQLAGLLGIVYLWRFLEKRIPFRTILVFGGLYLMTALPSLGPLVLQQLTETAPVESQGMPSMFYILAQFRIPHHYLFFSFPLRSLLKFGGLVVLGGTSFALLSRRQILYQAHFLVKSFVIMGISYLVTFLFTEMVPVLFVAQLQLFKTTVLAKLLCIIVICGLGTVWLPSHISTLLSTLLKDRLWTLVLLLGTYLFVSGGLLFEGDWVREKVGPFAREGTPQEQVEVWARTQTPRDAVFAVPPSWAHFRAQAQRAMVVSFKAFPYRNPANYQWFERLTTLAPLDLPDRATPALQNTLDASFLGQSAAALRHLADEYGFSYVVRSIPLDTVNTSFELVYSSDDWRVYHLVSEEPRAE